MTLNQSSGRVAGVNDPSNASLHGTFSYGSLVNAGTLPKPTHAVPCSLNGWQRLWFHRVAGTNIGGVCALTVYPRSDAVTKGVLLVNEVEELPERDKREEGYSRVVLPLSDMDTFERDPLAESIHVYRSDPEHFGAGDSEFPILWSYVETVLIGYRNVFGDEAIEEFITTTGGWHAPVLLDRKQAIYPRHTPVSPRESDELLERTKLAVESIGVKLNLVEYS